MFKALSHICKRLHSRSLPNPGVLRFKRSTPLFRLIAVAVSYCVLETAIFPDLFKAYSVAQTIPALNLPYVPGELLKPSQGFVPPMIKGLRLDPQNPFQIDFVLDGGDSQDADQAEAMRMVKYFFTIITTPEKDLWVNLSPVEQDRVMADNLAATDMGRDMLLQDYLLKQLAASMTYPQEELGQKFWDRVRAKVFEQYGNVEIPANLVSKVWIVPESATVYASENAALILNARLDVMLDQDYQAMKAEDGTASSRWNEDENNIYKEDRI